MSSLNQALRAALDNRQDLLAELKAQGTDCYRLFHGSQEGAGGLTIDRYGPQLLVQSFHQALQSEEYRSPAELALKKFAPESGHIRNQRGDYSHTFNRKDLQQELHQLFAAQQSFGNPHVSDGLKQGIENLLMQQEKQEKDIFVLIRLDL